MIVTSTMFQIPHMSGLLGGLGGFALGAVIMILIGLLSRSRPPSGDQSKSKPTGRIDHAQDHRIGAQ